MRRLLFTTERTEDTENGGGSSTTESPRHRGQENLIELSLLGRYLHRYPRNRRSPFFLYRCASVVKICAGRITLVLATLALFTLIACSSKPSPNTLVMIIESSPTNLDPRVGIDAQSERIDELLFDSLVRRDEHFQLQPWLAESWQTPDSLTYFFHLRRGVRFHNGQPLTSRDVKWTFDSLLDGKLRTSKTSTFTALDHIDAPDDYTVIFHLKEPMASLLWNVSDGAIGIVPYGSGEDFNRKPVGSGPFRFVSAQQDKDVIVDRNPDYWATAAKLDRVEFRVIPDATTRALELRKRSADVVSNALTPDMVLTLQKDDGLQVLRGPGTMYAY